MIRRAASRGPTLGSAGGTIARALSRLAPGRRARGHLRVGRMASGQPVDLPWLAARGNRDGPCLWINAAVHGDEVNGVLAALDFFRELDPRRLAGHVVVTPVANPLALDARRKRVPQDELDLDQSFPGRADGLTSELLAARLWEEVSETADILVSFHTMNPYFDSSPYAVYKLASEGFHEEDLLVATACFKPFAACRMPVEGGAELPGNVAGALDFQALRSGALAFMVELGGGSRQEPAFIAQGVEGLRRLAELTGMVERGPSASGRMTRVLRRRHVMTPHGGFFRRKVAPGVVTPAGTLIGTVEDVFGRTVERVAFSEPVAILGIRSDPVVHSGDRIAFIGTEWDEVDIPLSLELRSKGLDHAR